MTKFSIKTEKQKMQEVLKLAYKAGKVLLSKSKSLKKLKIFDKKAEGVASEADIAAEKIILNGLRKKFPEDKILSEEDYFHNRKNCHLETFQNDSSVWVVDPLDGTNNFLNGLDYYSVCIALVEYGRPVLGVVYRPSTQECFIATQKKGAYKGYLQSETQWLKKKKIFLAKNPKPLNKTMLVTGLGNRNQRSVEAEFYLYKNIMLKTRAIRRFGGAALDLCYVAEGVFDGFWQQGLCPWDIAAAGLVCEEAGVKVTNYLGQAYSPFDPSILVARPPLHSKLMKQFKIK